MTSTVSTSVTSQPTPSEALDNEKSPVEGVTNAEYRAVMGLIDAKTGQSKVQNSQKARQAFNVLVTEAIFTNGGGKWDHETHFNRAKEVVRSMIIAGEVLAIRDDGTHAVIGIELPTEEIIPGDPESYVDPQRQLIASMTGRLATAASQLEAAAEYHSEAEAMVYELLDENEDLKSENAALRAENEALCHSPREAELLAKLALLQQQLDTETRLRQIAERKGEAIGLSLEGAKAKVKAADIAARQVRQELRDKDSEIAELHRKTKEEVEAAHERGLTKGWQDAIGTLELILSHANYDDHSAKVILALLRTEEKPELVYNIIDYIIYATEQLEKLTSTPGEVRSIRLPDGTGMQAASDFQKRTAKTTLEDTLPRLQLELQRQLEIIADAKSVTA